ncbi:MAG: hypothetical protein K2P84_11865, partial [Undibacterium sp.]|nr:hypothetical protein [Undibacterium sp.]
DSSTQDLSEQDPSKLSVDANSLVAIFTQANQTPDGWDPGWEVYQMTADGRISVQKAERSRVAIPGDYASYKWTKEGVSIGDHVTLRVYPGSSEAQAGYFFAFGSTLTDQFDEFDLMRFYFNITAEAAPTLLSTLTALLNRHAIPFRFKTLVDARAYQRADAAVLYLAKRYYHQVVSLLPYVYHELGNGIQSATPMFCKTLAPGMGVAEDPGGGESFGQHRCGLVAAGLVDAWVAGLQDPDAKLIAIEKRFNELGINLATPHLNPHSLELIEPAIGLAASLL